MKEVIAPHNYYEEQITPDNEDVKQNYDAETKNVVVF